MRLSATDIRQQQFAIKLIRGFDPQEVDAFLEEVADDFEELTKENNLLKEQLATLEERTKGIEARERTLQETLITTQKIAEEFKENARREAELVLREAHLRSGRKLLAHAAHRLPRRARGNSSAVAEDDVARTGNREVVRDRGAGRARAGYDDASHRSSSSRSASVSTRSGARTSGRTGTPRRPRTCLIAAWKGKRSSAARVSATTARSSGTPSERAGLSPIPERSKRSTGKPRAASLLASST